MVLRALLMAAALFLSPTLMAGEKLECIWAYGNAKSGTTLCQSGYKLVSGFAGCAIPFSEDTTGITGSFPATASYSGWKESCEDGLGSSSLAYCCRTIQE